MLKPNHAPEPGFEISSSTHRIRRRPLSDLPALEADLAEIAARASARDAAAIPSLAVAAQAGDVKAKARLREIATVTVATDDVTALAWAAAGGDLKAKAKLRALAEPTTERS